MQKFCGWQIERQIRKWDLTVGCNRTWLLHKDATENCSQSYAVLDSDISPWRLKVLVNPVRNLVICSVTINYASHVCYRA
jgi:hypothetical protein